MTWLTMGLALALTCAPPPATGRFTATAGDWQVAFDAAGSWSPWTISHAGRPLAHERGSQGSALQSTAPLAATGAPGWVGSTFKHETVTALTVTVDGTEQAISVGASYSGETVQVVKESQLGGLQQRLTVTVTAEQIRCTYQFTATADQPVQVFFAGMHNWQTSFTRYAAQPLNGERRQGELTSGNSYPFTGQAHWAALYDPAAELAVVTALSGDLTALNNGRGLVLWDHPNYHKLLVELSGRGTVPTGTSLAATVHLAAVAAKADEWVAAAAAAAARLAPVAPTPSATVAASGSTLVTITVGKWQVAFDESRAWTIHHIDYAGRTVSGANGFHGAVITPAVPAEGSPTANWIGTGHTEGGREQIESIALELDGQPVDPTRTASYAGERFTLRKQSRIDRLRHHAVLTLQPDGLTEHHRFTAVTDQTLRIFYAFMHCWQPFFGHWAAGTQDGVITGRLASDGDFEVNRDVLWSAIYDEASQVGMVTSYGSEIKAFGGGLGTRYWDLERYHKQYLHIAGNTTLPAGTELDYTLHVQAVEATPGEWVAAAAAVAAKPLQ